MAEIFIKISARQGVTIKFVGMRFTNSPNKIPPTESKNAVYLGFDN